MSESALRALYALAVVRLVNGVTDPAQKGRFAAPVASLARSAGLPALLVDLRHEARAPAPNLRTLLQYYTVLSVHHGACHADCA